MVADAAQTYEKNNTALVLEAFDAKAATLRSEKGADAITVAKARLVKGWPGGSEHAVLAHASLFHSGVCGACCRLAAL